MIWLGKVIILTLALVSKAHGRSIAFNPIAYTSLFRQMPELDISYQEEKGNTKGTISSLLSSVLTLSHITFTTIFRFFRYAS